MKKKHITWCVKILLLVLVFNNLLVAGWNPKLCNNYVDANNLFFLEPCSLNPTNCFLNKELPEQIIISRFQFSDFEIFGEVWEYLYKAYNEFKKTNQNVNDYYVHFEKFDDLDNTYVVTFIYVPLHNNRLENHYYYPVFSYIITDDKQIFKSFFDLYRSKVKLYKKILNMKRVDSDTSLFNKIEEKLLNDPFCYDSKFSSDELRYILMKAYLQEKYKIKNISFPAMIIPYIEMAYNEYKKIIKKNKFKFDIICYLTDSHNVKILFYPRQQVNIHSGRLFSARKFSRTYSISRKNMKLKEILSR